MIARIEGTLIHADERSFVIDVSGVGYELFVSTDTRALYGADIGKPLALWVRTHVREDAIELYGFKTRDERTFFDMLISVSGVGPRSAIGIIGVTSIETLRHAIAANDTSYLTKVSGIGRKTAEKIVIELRDKLAALGHGKDTSIYSGDADVLEALESLGYRHEEARNVLKNLGSGLTTAEKIKEALKMLGK